jgi:uncharacterized protein (DUF433 family)
LSHRRQPCAGFAPVLLSPGFISHLNTKIYGQDRLWTAEDSTWSSEGLSFTDIPLLNRLDLDRSVVHGKPVIRGTRLPVTVVVGSLAGGMTFQESRREYDLTADDIRAALKFVADLAEQESFHPLPAV